MEQNISDIINKRNGGKLNLQFKPRTPKLERIDLTKRRGNPTPNVVNQPQVVSKQKEEEPKNYTPYYLIGGGVLAVLGVLVYLKAKKNK